MKISTRSKSLLAGALALGLGFVAAPAIAQDTELPPTPEVSVTEDVFTDAGWGTGVEVTLTLPADVTADDIHDVRLWVGSYTSDGSGIVGETILEPGDGADGVYTGHVVPVVAPEVAVDENGPFFVASGAYTYTDAEGNDTEASLQYSTAGDVDLFVIDSELGIDGPATAPVSLITGDGVEIEVRGFQPGETVHVSGTSSATGELTGAFDAEVDINGRLLQSLFVSNAEVGETITFTFAGESGELTHTVTVVADPVDEDEEDDEVISPTPPESVETGIL